MSTEDNRSFNDISIFDIDTQRFYSIQFWIFLFLIIPSIICSLFSLYHFLRDRILRQALNNHIIIALFLINLFYEYTDMSLFIHYFRCFQSFSPTSTFRLIWGYIDWAFYALQLILYDWITIEKHILIFHDHLLSTARKRLFVHYLPPIIITIYCLLYYAIVFFASQCENNFDNLTIPSCFPCAYENNVLNMYETIAHSILPILIIVISSALLLFRVLWQKYHAHRQIHWRRYRKMTIQVLSISSLYLIFPFPYYLITILHLCGMPSDIGVEFLSRWMFCTYYTLLLFPIIVIGSSPELKAKLKKTLQFRRQRLIVGPAKFNVAPMIDNRITIQ